MSEQFSHIVEKLVLEVQTNSKKLAYAIKDEKDVFFLEELMTLLAAILDSYEPEHGQLIKLDSLRLELNASSTDFEFDIKKQLQEKLAAILPSYVFDNINMQLDEQRPRSNSKTDALLYFLHKGIFPWWFETPKDNSAMDALIYECIDQNSFIEGFSKGLEQAQFTKRCIGQLSDGFLGVVFTKLIQDRLALSSNFLIEKQTISKLYNNNMTRVALWSFLATSLVKTKKETITSHWYEYIKAAAKSLAEQPLLVKQLNSFTVHVLGKTFVDKQNIKLLADSENKEQKLIDQNLESSQAKKSIGDFTKKERDKQKQLLDANLEVSDKNKSEVDNNAAKTLKKEDNQSRKKNKDKTAISIKNRDDVADKENNPNTQELASKSNPKKQPEGDLHPTDLSGNDHDVELANDVHHKERENAKVYKKSNQEDQKTLQTDNQNNVPEEHKTEDLQSLTENNNALETTTKSQNQDNTSKQERLQQLQDLEGLLPIEQTEQPEQFYAANCGLVLLHPFLTSFLKNCDLVDDSKSLKDPTLTAHLLHYVATGKTEAYEYELQFERFLCHISAGLPIERHVEIPRELIDKADQLLKAVLGHLPQLKSTEPKLLQNEFLSRDGKVMLAGQNPRITIERKTQDMLLDSKPWSTSLVKLPWLPYLIFVDW